MRRVHLAKVAKIVLPQQVVGSSLHLSYVQAAILDDVVFVLPMPRRKPAH